MAAFSMPCKNKTFASMWDAHDQKWVFLALAAVLQTHVLVH